MAPKLTSSGKPHYFAFYPGDWLAPKVNAMDIDVRGVYISLLAAIHSSGLKLENNDKDLCKSLNIPTKTWNKAKNILFGGNNPLLYIEGDFILQEGVVEAYHQLSAKIKQNRDAGSLGGSSSNSANKNNPTSNEDPIEF